MQEEGKRTGTHWSPGGQIYFIDGKAFGTASDSRTIEIGSEEEILRCLKDNKTTGNKITDNILRVELDSRGQTEEPKIRRRRKRRR